LVAYEQAIQQSLRFSLKGTNQGLSVPFLHTDGRNQGDNGDGKQHGLAQLQAGGKPVFPHMPERVDDAKDWP
jgi:hypothetical protein